MKYKKNWILFLILLGGLHLRAEEATPKPTLPPAEIVEPPKVVPLVAPPVVPPTVMPPVPAPKAPEMVDDGPTDFEKEMQRRMELAAKRQRGIFETIPEDEITLTKHSKNKPPEEINISFTTKEKQEINCPEESSSTYILRGERQENGQEIKIGGGTAVGVNLKKYGLKGKRYLLTAGHCVKSKEYVANGVYILLDDGFIKCEVIKVDSDMDIALLKCVHDLPSIADLDDDNTPTADEELVNVGCPDWTTPTAHLAQMVDSNNNLVWLIKSWTFTHGSSGSPLYRNGKVAGIGIQAILNTMTGCVIKHVGIFVPIKRIKTLIVSAVPPK